MRRLDFLTVEMLQSNDEHGNVIYLRRYSNGRWECYNPEEGGWYPVKSDLYSALEVERDAFTNPTNLTHKGSGEH